MTSMIRNRWFYAGLAGLACARLAYAIAIGTTGAFKERGKLLVKNVETLTAPSVPAGAATGLPATSLGFTTGGAISSLGHAVEYRFYWGDGTYSAWGAGTSASHAWPTAGTYAVSAEARCQVHADVRAASPTLSVVIAFPTESISTPDTPAGSSAGIAATNYGYTVSGATSNLGHTIEYRFNWGDGSYSAWSTLTNASHSWATDAVYFVTAEARCQADPGIVSAASTSLALTISAVEVVGLPSVPSGPASGTPVTSYLYAPGGANCNYGHAVEYSFDWGDGNYSSWSTSSASHGWASSGSYAVKAQARCQVNPTVVSGWSTGLTVTVETVSIPNIPSGLATGIPGTSYAYTTGGSTSSLGHVIAYRFNWGDGTYSSWGTGTSASHTWSAVGTYNVSAEARCQSHTGVGAVSTTMSVLIKPVKITTIAGNGSYGYSGDTGSATSAQLDQPSDVAVDASGNVYIADTNNHRVRKVTASTGIITTYAGTGVGGYSGDGGAATSAMLYTPQGVAVDGSGNLYVAQGGYSVVRKVAAGTGTITTVAGNGA